MAKSTEFNEAVSELASVAGNWDNGLPAADDTVSMGAGKTCKWDLDTEGTMYASLTVPATAKLYHDPTATTSLEARVLDIDGEYNQGTEDTPIPAAYTCKCVMNAAANGNETADIGSAGKWLTCGNACYNMQDESWGSCWTQLTAQAAAAQKDIVVPEAFANALQDSGDELILRGTTDDDEDELVVVASKSGGTITLVDVLANTHDADAHLGLLTRNVQIVAADPTKRFSIDNNSSVEDNVALKLTELSGMYRWYGTGGGYYTKMSYCGCHGYSVGYQCLGMFTQMVVAGDGSSNYQFFRPYGSYFYECMVGNSNVAFGDHYGICGGQLIIFGMANYAFINMALELEGVEVYNTTNVFSGHISGTIVDLYVEDIQSYDIGQSTGLLQLRYANVSQEYSPNSRGPRTWSSQDHGRVLGEYTKSSYTRGSIVRQSVITHDGGDYAAAVTPESACSSSTFVDVRIAIPNITHGDAISLSAYGTANAAFGNSADDKPLLILDPRGINDATATSTQQCNNNDTGVWTELTCNGVADMGGAGKAGHVEAVFRIQSYPGAGAIAYLADITIIVNGEIFLVSDLSSWGPNGPLLQRTTSVSLDDIYNRIGAPAGASVSADIAAIKAIADAVQTVTDQFTFGANGVDATVGDIFPTLDIFAASFTAAYLDMSGQMDDIEMTQAAQTVVLSRVIGLCGENQIIDTTAHDDNNKMTSAQMRIFASAEDLGNEENELGTYAIAATYNDDGEMQTYQATLETP